MYIELLDNKNLAIGINNYTQEYINLFDEDVSTKVLSAENENPQEVNLDPSIQPKKQAEHFYSIVANILWTTK